MSSSTPLDGLVPFLDALVHGSPQALRLTEEVLLIVSSVVSFLGCAFVFTTWKSFSLPNYLSRRIVASMGLAGLLTAFGFSLSILVNGIGIAYMDQEALCYAQALVLQYFYLSSYLWTSCFAFHLYQIIVVRNEYPEKLLWRYRLVGWGLPGAVVAFLILRQLTGHLGVGAADRRWCWISVHARDSQSWQKDGAWLQFLLFYMPISCIFIFNGVLYFVILRFLRGDPMVPKLRNRVVLYLVVFFLCSIWGAINRLVQFCSASHAPSSFLTVMECICDPLQPLLNAVVYGTNKSSLDAYKERFCSSWFYNSLPSSSDEEESGLDNTSLLSDHEEESDDRAFYYQDIRRDILIPRQLTIPPTPLPDDDDKEYEYEDGDGGR